MNKQNESKKGSMHESKKKANFLLILIVILSFLQGLFITEIHSLTNEHQTILTFRFLTLTVIQILSVVSANNLIQTQLSESLWKEMKQPEFQYDVSIETCSLLFFKMLPATFLMNLGRNLIPQVESQADILLSISFYLLSFIIFLFSFFVVLQSLQIKACIEKEKPSY